MVKENVSYSYDLPSSTNSTATEPTTDSEDSATTNYDTIVVEIVWYNNMSFTLSCIMVSVLFIIHCKRLELIEKQAQSAPMLGFLQELEKPIECRGT